MKIMVKITGYKLVNYSDFQKKLHISYVDSKKSLVDLSSCVGVRSQATVNNCFNTTAQMVSDNVLTKLMDCLGMDGFILWHKGLRTYYIKSK
jgi:hypothetical protein